MPSRRSSVRTFQPTQVERFDDQFWPIMMALCITATILAATIVTLMAGFWMWVSLMILPAAIAVLTFALRFIDSKRLRRSIQLAMILSLAAHCGFLIFAKKTSIFEGFLVQANKDATVVKQQRVIQISQQVQTLPWMDENPVPSPDVPQPTPQKQAKIDTATARPQPAAVTSQTPTENPQLVRSQKPSETVPRLGKNLSRLSRQTENNQPKSSQQVAMAKPAATQPNRTSRPGSKSEAKENSTSASMNAAKPELQPQAEPDRIAERPKPDSSRPTRATQPSSDPAPARVARNERPETPATRTTPARAARTTTTSPRVDAEAPRKSLAAPIAASQPESPRAASRPSDRANLERRTQSSETPTVAKLQRPKPATSPTRQRSQSQPERRQTTSSIASRQPTSKPTRATTTGPKPATPQLVQRPRPANTAKATSGVAEMNPQPTALQRSTNGTSGVGRTANLDRNTGSRQSSAMTPSDSMRRREQTTRQSNPNALALREKSQVPRAAAAKEIPSMVNRPDSVPVASQPATDSPAELTASSSASLTQSNADARKSETSVAKGSGSVDLGPQKIVSETVSERVEGGGQPDIQPRPATRQASARGDAGAAEPNIVADMMAETTTDDGGSSADRVASDTPIPDATADTLSERTGQMAASGAPMPSDNSRDDRLNTMESDLADASPGRTNRDSDADEDEDDEERQRREAARALARNARRLAGSEGPTIESEIEFAAGPSGQTDGQMASAPSAEIGDSVAGDSMDQPQANGDQGQGLAAKTSNNRETTTEFEDSEGSGRQGADRGQSATEVAANPSSRVGPSRRMSNAEPGFQGSDQPEIAGQPQSAQAGQGTANQINDSQNIANLQPTAPAGMSLKIEATPGPAGIGNEVQEDPGIDSRRASRESPAIQSRSESRFRKQDIGGVPSVSSAPVIAKDAFRTRNQPSRSASGPKTEEAIEFGLAFLARQQQQDGSWTLHGITEDRKEGVKRVNSDSAATGLAILAFQGAGYNHKEFKYAGQVQSGIDWLVQNQKVTGELYIDSDNYSDGAARFYSHGIATLALAEAYGMTQDEDLRLPVQLALDYIADTQHQRLGGWRYRTGSESDTSVTGWMMMAMQSGKLAGLETDDETWLGIRRWLRMAESPTQQHLFRYNPEALDQPETRHGRDPSPCMTAVGLLMNVYLGWDRLDPRLTDGGEYLLQHLPDDSTITKRDTYYWYYATQIVRHIGGEAWQQWHGKLHPLLIGSQIRNNGNQSNPMAGSWDPINPVPDRWGAQAGRLYVTAMNLLSLEVDYRLLPLHDDTVD